MRTSFVVLSAAGLAAALAGCSPIPVPESQALRLVDLPQERVAIEIEWRDGWRVPAGQHRLDLGRVPKKGVLRLGVLAGEGGPVRVRVYAGTRLVDAFEVAAPAASRTAPAASRTAPAASRTEVAAWRERRLSLARHAWLRRSCTLVFQSDHEFRIGPCEVVSPDPSKPNVLIVLIDTLRLDHLGCYYYPLDTSPAIDRLAEDSIRFWRLMPQSSWTRPSVASLMTSTYPSAHGTHDMFDVMRPGLPSLAAALGRAGYESHGLVTNAQCLPLWGFGDGFSRYVDVETTNAVAVDTRDGRAVDVALATLRQAVGRPWFLYLHLMAPHAPYAPPAPYSTAFMPDRFVGTRPQIRLQKEMARYDGEIAYADAQMGRLLEALKTLGLYDDTLIILVSDHGEQFMEHGEQGHGKSLFEEELRVPFIMKMPHGANAGEERKQLVQMIDIGPTVLDIVGALPEGRFQGRCLRDLIEHDPIEDRVGYASLRFYGHSLRAAKTRRQKYIHDVLRQEPTWYDLENDPHEHRGVRHPLPDAEPLAAFASRVASHGAVGLHLVITGSVGAEGVVAGEVLGPDLGPFELHCSGINGRAWQIDEGIAFRIELENAPVVEEGLRLLGEGLQPTVAHLHVNMPLDGAVTVDVQRDGRPVAPESTVVGPDKARRTLTDATLDLRDIVAEHDAFDTARLPRQFGVYLWAVRGAGSLTKDELSPEMTGALHALGYLE